jgi:ADP-heptose:LPS heptosyltransferase
MKLLDKLLETYFIIYRYKKGVSIGDHFLMTAILPKIKEKYNRPILVFTAYPDLFLYNPNIYRTINYKNPGQEEKDFLFLNTPFENDTSSGMALLMNNIIKKTNKSEYIHEFNYLWMIKENAHIKKSLVEFYSYGLNIDATNCKPEIYLSEEEKANFLNKFNLPKKYYIIHSGSVTKFKNYNFDDLQKIISKTKDKINWIQIGIEDDERFNDVCFDLSGKLTLRELFVSIYFSDCVLSIHGFQTLIATAFGIKNYCILSDYIYPEQTSYDNIIYIKRNKFHDVVCSICSGWGCGCKCSMKMNWKNEIDPDDIIKILLNDIKQ